MGLINIFQRSDLGTVIAAHPITYFDIGARGGFEQDLHPIAFAVDAIGFEPEREEKDRLDGIDRKPWRTTRFLDHAISGEGGTMDLHIPDDPQGASLLLADERVCGPFNKPQFFEIVKTSSVPTKTLDQTVHDLGLNCVDYLKIDIEGVEFEVLDSAVKTIDQLLAIKTEAAFLPFRGDHALASDIERYLRDKGFVLFDMIRPAHWRYHGNVVDPFLSGEPIAYSRGQLAHADFLFMRDPSKLNVNDDVGAERLLKLAVIAMSFGYFDFAARIFDMPPLASMIGSKFDIDASSAVNRCSGLYGKVRFRRAFGRQIRGLSPFLRRLATLL